MRGHVGLYVKGILFGVKTASHIEGKRLVGAAAKLRGDLAHGDGVLVHHAVEALVCVTVRGEIADGSKVVANGQVAAGLYARKADLLVV